MFFRPFAQIQAFFPQPALAQYEMPAAKGAHSEKKQA